LTAILGSEPDEVDFPTENCCANTTVFASAGPAVQTGCSLRDGLAVEYSLNSGYDCCPESGPDFCFGRCEQGQCVTDDCCNCSSCEGPEDETCKLPGSTLEFCADADGCHSTFTSSSGPLAPDIPFEIICFQVPPTCFDHELVVDAVCSDSGCMPGTPTPTATPTATPTNTRVPDGGACDEPVDCNSGNCVNGLCCNEPCTEPLERCNVVGQLGTCIGVSAQVPAASSGALLFGLVTLVIVAGLALLRRSRSPI
jgi:hypothetical protein